MTDPAARSERAALDIAKTQYSSSMKSPQDAYLAFAEKGAANAKMSKRKIFHQAVLGGAYVGCCTAGFECTSFLSHTLLLPVSHTLLLPAL